ncbi:GntR family transcriptional regulator [Nocardia abscessus]|uniref:GntR family transcriptional regulator n=1 Tax=Nocardia abscessus TaxID=120957 RepID=UPI002454B0D6|nr:GntR family transcriptional regulator [Nocardia abscessus]
MHSDAAGLAAYRKVAEQIKSEIRSGIRKPAEQLPSNRQLAEDFKVSLGTAQKALQVLQQEGWVVTTPAVGTFIADQQPTEPASAVEELRAEVSELRKLTDDLANRLDRLEARQASQ